MRFFTEDGREAKCLGCKDRRTDKFEVIGILLTGTFNDGNTIYRLRERFFCAIHRPSYYSNVISQNEFHRFATVNMFTRGYAFFELTEIRE